MTLITSKQDFPLTIISTEQLIDNISQIFYEILIETAKISDRKVTIFDAKTQAAISIKDYLKRVFKFTHCSQESIVCSLIYLDRVFQLNFGLILHEKNLHRL